MAGTHIAGIGLMLGAALCTAAVADEAPFGLDHRTRVGGLQFSFDAPSVGDVKLTRAFPHIQLRVPLYITPRPGDDSELYVVSRTGVIQFFPNQPGARMRGLKTFIDLTDRVTDRGGEEGLLGLAFNPDYASNGFFYVYYSAKDDPRRTILSRFHRSASDPTVGDPASEEILVTVPDPFPNHQAGCIQFGPDGKLYLTVGDGGSGQDPFNNGQNRNTLLGKLLRLNGDGTIPEDNPLVNVPDTRGEIWAYGLRNPWRFSFDSLTGKLWLADVGQGRREEVDVVIKGGNYGWRIYEGDLSNGKRNPDHLPPDAFEQPVFVYPHSPDALPVNGHAITGGYVYRGTKIPSLVGEYLFADFEVGRVWALSQDNGVVTGVRLIGDVPGPASFGEDNAGNVYITSFGGQIYRVDPNDNPSSGGIPQKLSQTGLFTDLATLAPTPGMIEYTLNVPFWSDGTTKRRWIVPHRLTKVAFQPGDAWLWPADSIIVKHFEIVLADGSTKRLETRVLLNGSNGWQGFTYRWNDAGTDADLLADRQTVQIDAADATAPGGVRHQTYEFPGPGECLGCHNSAAGFILGARTAQMNRTFTYPNGVTDNQLRSLNHIGLFSSDIGDAAQYAKLPALDDESAPLHDRARAYLDVNCAICHRPEGPTPEDMDLRLETARSHMQLLGVAPSSGNLGVPGAVRVKRRDKEHSVLWLRMKALDDNRMPPIASHVVDQQGVDLIGRWIDAGAP